MMVENTKFYDEPLILRVIHKLKKTQGATKAAVAAYARVLLE